MISKSPSGAAFLLALATLFGPAPPAAAVDCQAWQLLPEFNAVQENGFAVVFDLDGVATGNISGGASYHAGSNFALVQGKAYGTFDGNVLRLQVQWQDDTLAQYEGYVQGGGSLAGFTRNLSIYNSPQVRWRSKQTFVCAKLAAAQCPSGQVWRERFDGDTACVTPDERFRLQNGTCRSGYVWRGKFNGDNVCVTPAERAEAQKPVRKLGKVKIPNG